VNDNVLYRSLFCDAIFAVTEATELAFLVGERGCDSKGRPEDGFA
jgi:hypothetical protein